MSFWCAVKAHKLNAVGSVQIAAVHLHPEAFSAENGLQTPTFKLKRPQAKEVFLDVILKMYEGLDDN